MAWSEIADKLVSLGEAETGVYGAVDDPHLYGLVRGQRVDIVYIRVCSRYGLIGGYSWLSEHYNIVRISERGANR